MPVKRNLHHYTGAAAAAAAPAAAANDAPPLTSPPSPAFNLNKDNPKTLTVGLCRLNQVDP